MVATTKPNKSKKPIPNEDEFDADDDEENTKDWWTKYFWSYEKLCEESTNVGHLCEGRRDGAAAAAGPSDGKEQLRSKLGIKGAKLVARISPKHAFKAEKTKVTTAVFQVIFQAFLFSSVN